jgi:hypothetical protein
MKIQIRILSWAPINPDDIRVNFNASPAATVVLRQTVNLFPLGEQWGFESLGLHQFRYNQLTVAGRWILTSEAVYRYLSEMVPE